MVGLGDAAVDGFQVEGKGGGFKGLEGEPGLEAEGATGRRVGRW